MIFELVDPFGESFCFCKNHSLLIGFWFSGSMGDWWKKVFSGVIVFVFLIFDFINLFAEALPFDHLIVEVECGVFSLFEIHDSSQ